MPIPPRVDQRRLCPRKRRCSGDLGRGSSAEEHVEMESTKKLATPSLLPSTPSTPVPKEQPCPWVQSC